MSNIYLFFGEDDFSLRRKIDIWKVEFAKKYTSQAVVVLDCAELNEAEILKRLEMELAPSLFSTKKLLIIRDALPKKADQEKLVAFFLNLPNVAPKDFFLVFWQTSRPDGRLKFTKEFKALVNVTEFELPHGPTLNAWIKAMAKNLQSEITDSAADLLAQYLGRDLFEEKKAGGRVIERKEAFDLWQVYSELSKLAANTTHITPETVKSLVRAKVPDSVFNLSDDLASGNQRAALQSLDNYLSTATGDDKSNFIKVIGLLAEQFRSLLLVNLLQDERLDNASIAEKLGWSSGRVFILSKHSRNFSIPKLKELLAKLLMIDQKLKSSAADPRLLLDLFISQAV